MFQIVGDGFCAAFPTASEAVAAALAAQRALAVERWSDVGAIRVRMAVQTGTVDLRAGKHKAGEYELVLTLSHAARLLGVAHGGQILVSAATREMLREDPPRGADLRDLGRHRLRDLAGAGCSSWRPSPILRSLPGCSPRRWACARRPAGPWSRR